MYSHYIWPRNQKYTVASATNARGSVFRRRPRLVLGQCWKRSSLSSQQPWEVWFLGGDPDYFWDSVGKEAASAVSSLLPLSSFVPGVYRWHTVCVTTYQSWARDNVTMLSGHKTPSRHWDLTICRFFSGPWPVPVAILPCRVVALSRCRVVALSLLRS